MSSRPITLEEVLKLARRLSPTDKLRLAKQIAPDLETTIGSTSPASPVSLYGSLRDLGPAPSSEDIDEVRREMFQNFPRNDAA